ncbi:MAG: flagella basal body P-ring formation protein FlgA, partial [Betaproteobacteria bacterium]|nr:flagella basal body P-ring formation protein FlgA [Betaproteobacteria bacterium]
WVAAQQNTPAESLQVTPLDMRLNIPACTQKIQFDLPFGNRQSVRARCDQPAWLHFIQVMARPDAAQPVQANPSSTQAPTSVKMNPGMVMRPVLVATQAIKRGTFVAPQQFTVIEMALPSGETSYLSGDLPAQTPLRSYDLKAAQMVRRGQQVMVSVGEGKGFLITLRAEAQQDGVLGEQIRLKNPESGRSLSAVITGFNAARAL